jgi:hypothetical protein
MLYAGRNAVISYDPHSEELGYSRNNVRSAIDELVVAYFPGPGGATHDPIK